VKGVETPQVGITSAHDAVSDETEPPSDTDDPGGLETETADMDSDGRGAVVLAALALLAVAASGGDN